MALWSQRPSRLRLAELYILLLVPIAAAAGIGCKKAAAVFLDLPAESEEVESPAAVSPAGMSRSVQNLNPVQDTIRRSTPIEKVFHPDSALAMLPKDNAGNVDWVAALREGVILPRSSPPGSTSQETVSAFAFDFHYKGFDGWFPHSTHVEWLSCESCHPAIYRYRGETPTMEAINGGESCGRCHGTVAFPANTCERCHLSMEMPADRNEPELLGDVTFVRVTPTEGAASSSYPPGRFRHWTHRIRYRCTACHPELFEARAGSTTLTMDEMRRGQGCGACHDDRSAFGLLECGRCHVASASTQDSLP